MRVIWKRPACSYVNADARYTILHLQHIHPPHVPFIKRPRHKECGGAGLAMQDHLASVLYAWYWPRTASWMRSTASRARNAVQARLLLCEASFYCCTLNKQLSVRHLVALFPGCRGYLSNTKAALLCIQG